MVENNIKSLRQKKGMTQRQLAEAAETSQQQIQRIEAGVQEARFDLAARISKALDEPLEQVFPSVALPLRRAGKRLSTPDQLYTDDNARSELQAAGFDMHFEARMFKYRIRGGAEGILSVTGPENERLWSAIQETDPLGFIIFDAEDRRFALNPKHLIFCQFLFEAPSQTPEIADDDEEDWEIEVHLADGSKPMKFSVWPDSRRSIGEDEDDDGRSTQLQDMFMFAEEWPERRLKLTDEDGETAWFLADDVAMFSAPLTAVEPDLLQSDEDDCEK